MRSRTFSETYQEDTQLFRTHWARFGLVVFGALLVTLPAWGDPYLVYMANVAGIAVVAALGLNILTGYTGQISLGHAAFVAVGAYTAAILGTQAGWPFWLAIPAGGVLAAGFGVLLGIPCLRLKGLYLAMATMSFGVVIQYVATNWDTVTKGVRGISLPPASFLGISLAGDERFFFVVLVFTTALALAAKNLTRTRVGRAFVAIRDRDIAAEAVGVDLTRYKVMSFAISSFYAGVAGGLYAFSTGYVHPEQFSVMLSVQYIAMIIIGGLGSVLGSILGAAFLTAVPEVISSLAETVSQTLGASQTQIGEEWNIAIFGALIILFLLLEPTGLAGIWVRVKNCFRNWPFTY